MSYWVLLPACCISVAMSVGLVIAVVELTRGRARGPERQERRR